MKDVVSFCCAVAFFVDLSRLEYDDIEEDPCAVPACPPYLATFTMQWRFIAIGLIQPVFIMLMVIVLMFLWNFCVQFKSVVAFGSKFGLCSTRRADEDLPESLAQCGGVPIVHLLNDATTRMPEPEKQLTERKKLLSTSFYERWIQFRCIRKVFTLNPQLEPTLEFTGAPEDTAIQSASTGEHKKHEGVVSSVIGSKSKILVDLRACTVLRLRVVLRRFSIFFLL